MSDSFDRLLIDLNTNAGKALISVSCLIVVARFIYEMCRGGIGSEKSEYVIVLKDFLLLVILVGSFSPIYKFVQDLPGVLNNLVIPSGVNFNDSVKNMFRDMPRRKFIFWDIDGASLITIRSFFLSISNGLYKLIITLVMAFFSIGVFARTMLGMKVFSNLMIGVVLFTACYPVLFVVVDAVVLQAFDAKTSSDSLSGALSVMTLGSVTYTVLPILLLKATATRGVDFVRSAANSFKAPIGARYVRSGFKAFNRAGTTLGDKLSTRAEGPYGQRRQTINDKYIMAQRERKKNIKALKKLHRAAGVDSKQSIKKSNLDFQLEWGGYEETASSLSSGLKGYSGFAVGGIKKLSSTVQKPIVKPHNTGVFKQKPVVGKKLAYKDVTNNHRRAQFKVNTNISNKKNETFRHQMVGSNTIKNNYSSKTVNLKNHTDNIVKVNQKNSPKKYQPNLQK